MVTLRFKSETPNTRSPPQAHNTLPCADVLKQVLSHLDPQDAYNAAKAHPDFYRAAKDPDVWSSIAAKQTTEPKVISKEELRDLRSSPIERGIRQGARGMKEAIPVALLLPVGLVSFGFAFEVYGDAARKKEEKREKSRKIAQQASEDKGLLLERLREVGVGAAAAPEAALAAQVTQLRTAEKQRGQLEKALDKQLLRQDWDRVTKIVENLGADAPLHLSQKQLDAIAKKAASVGETEIARWLVRRGATLSQRRVEKLLKGEFLQRTCINHLVALGGTPPVYAQRHLPYLFGPSQAPSYKDQIFNDALADTAFDASELKSPETWPDRVVSRVQSALNDAQGGNLQQTRALVELVVRETESLMTELWATGEQLTARRRAMAAYEEVASRAVDIAKARVLQAAKNPGPSAQANMQGGSQRSLEGEFLADDANTTALKEAKDLAELVHKRADVLATAQLNAPLREHYIKTAHGHADAEQWVQVSLLCRSGLPAQVRDASGQSLVDKLQGKFNALVRGSKLTQAVAMKDAVANLVSEVPVQAHLDTSLHAALDAQDWRTCKQWLKLGANLNAVAPGQVHNARARITARTSDAIAARDLDCLEGLLTLMTPSLNLPWLEVAKPAFAGTFWRRRLPGANFEPTLLQKQLIRAMTDTVAADAWDHTLLFIRAGVPLSVQAARGLEAARTTAFLTRQWSELAKISKLQFLASSTPSI